MQSTNQAVWGGFKNLSLVALFESRTREKRAFPANTKICSTLGQLPANVGGLCNQGLSYSREEDLSWKVHNF